MHKNALKKLLRYNSYGYTLSKLFDQYLNKENIQIDPEMFGLDFYSNSVNDTNFSFFLKGFMTCEKLLMENKYLSPIELSDYNISYIENGIKDLSKYTVKEIIIESNRLNVEFNTYISDMNNEKLIFKKYFNIYQDMNEESLNGIDTYIKLNKVLNDSPEGAEYYFLPMNEYTKNYVVSNDNSYSYEFYENNEWISVTGSKFNKNQVFAGSLLMKDILISIFHMKYYHAKVIDFLKSM